MQGIIDVDVDGKTAMAWAGTKLKELGEGLNWDWLRKIWVILMCKVLRGR